jgi:CubicO group peptidase (beta-lactamase class C family)
MLRTVPPVRLRRCGVVAAAGLAVGACAGGAGFPDDLAWPQSEWTEVSAADAGFDPAALDDLAAQAEQGGSACLVVTQGGRLVDEWYWAGDADTRRDAYSVTKSLTSTLVGIARDRDLLDLDDRVADHVEQWQGTPSEDVEIRHVLANTSGREADLGAATGEVADPEADETAAALALGQQDPPGETWTYNNAAVQVLDLVLQRATGMPTQAFASEALFAPIGIGGSMGTDAAGNTITYSGAQMSCRDLARFGLLFLGGGAWGEEQVVSEGWVREATRPAGDSNAAYGYLWWLNRDGDIVDLVTGEREGPLIPMAPEDMYAAIGRGGQVVAVFPSEEVVVAAMADTDADGGFGIAELGPGIPAARADE